MLVEMVLLEREREREEAGVSAAARMFGSHEGGEQKDRRWKEVDALEPLEAREDMVERNRRRHPAAEQ